MPFCFQCGGDAGEPNHRELCGRQQQRVEALPHFDGETYEPDHDHERLGAQFLRVYGVMVDGRWRTLAEIETVCGDPQASISARLRDLRKPRFGERTVERRRRGEAERGLFEYRMVPVEH